MTTTHDVIIIGGGAIGAACARELSRAGRRVLILERGDAAGQAWRAAAGMLAPQVESHGDDPLFRLGLAARHGYAALAAELRGATGIDIGLWQDGMLQVAQGEVEVPELRAKVAWQRAAGEPCDWLSADEARSRWPWLGPIDGALWAEREGAVEPEKLVQALLTDARRHGAQIVEDLALTIDRQGDRAVGVTGRRGQYAAADIVLAAGAWSGQITGLPYELPVAPVRGQMLTLAWPERAPRAIVFGSRCYLLPRGGDVITGSTMEHAGFQAETTADGLARIVDAARTLCPSLVPDVRRSWAGLRPMTPDSLPIIGPAPGTRGLWYATGHGRNGILLASLTGRLIAQLLAGSASPHDLAPFAATRFLPPAV